MHISKTLFKNLTRCENFYGLYDMYLNKNLHNVKKINGVQIKESDFNNENIASLEMLDEEYDILYNMFDEETGDDLTLSENAQLEAFQDTFTEVERLACEYIKDLLNIDIVSSTNTFKQKKFSYSKHGNTYYCYLDAYNEGKNCLKIFEVKATTSTKFDDLHITIGKRNGIKLPIFKIDEKRIMQCELQNFIGLNIDDKIISQEDLELVKKTITNRFSSVGKYFYDVSVERNFIENYYKSIGESAPAIDYYLVVLNANYEYDGKIVNGKPLYNRNNNEDLFKIYDVNEISLLYQPIIEEETKILEKKAEHLEIKDHCLGTFCEYKKTTQCKFFNICNKCLLKDGSLFEFIDKKNAFKSLSDYNKKGERKTIDMYEVINQGIYTMTEAKLYTPKVDNMMQIKCFENNEIYLDKKRIKSSIEAIKYPIYHLDFESYNSPLPRFFGEKPYTQSLFQYSLHIEEKPGQCDLVLNHHEFLAIDHKDRRRELSEQLIKDIDLTNGGSVMVYNATFEKTRLKELASYYPDLSEQLLNIRDHVFDLLDVLDGSKKFYKALDCGYDEINDPSYAYYHKDLHGSFSIKKVLPLFTDLSYSNLDVKNGTEAILTYGMLPKMTEKEYNEKYLALRIYCRQDTWAMVKILDGLRKI